MKTQLKTLGIIFVSIGGLIGAFILLALLFGVLEVLGIMSGKPGQDIASAVVVFAVLTYPAIWIMQTGVALFQQKKQGRLPGIVLSSALFILLNVILLLTKDQPGKTGRGFLTFHILMILIGIYGLMVLLPARTKNILQ
jgi:hypothetical protein